MYEVHLQYDGTRGCKGDGDTIEEAVKVAKEGFEKTFGGKPRRWAAKVPGGFIKPRGFTNWRHLEKVLRSESEVLRPCCANPMLRGGKCCNCGTWIDDERR